MAAFKVASRKADLLDDSAVLCNHILVAPEVARQERILELGSGAGLLALLLARLRRDASVAPPVLATDVDTRALALLAHNAQLSKLFAFSRSTSTHPSS